MAGRRALGRRVRAVSTVRGLRRLKLNTVVIVVARRIIVGRRRVVAVVVVRLLLLLLRLPLLLLLAVVRLCVVRRLAVARRCPTQSPAGTAVGSVAASSATARGDASCGVLVTLAIRCERMIAVMTYENRKKMRIAPKIIRPRTSQRAQLFQVL